jgi:hypothetical protein
MPAAMSVAALVIATASLVLIPAGSTSGLGHASAKGTTATGSVTCTKVTGSITYRPAVRHVGSVPETQTFTFTARGCSTHNSNVHRVVSGTLKVSVRRSSNSCADLLVTHLSTSTGTWRPTSIRPTTATFSGYAYVFSKAGDIGFTVPNVGGTARVTGSFAGQDHGATSTATAYTNMTLTQFRAACLSASGLTRQTIVGGSARFS